MGEKTNKKAHWNEWWNMKKIANNSTKIVADAVGNATVIAVASNESGVLVGIWRFPIRKNTVTVIWFLMRLDSVVV